MVLRTTPTYRFDFLPDGGIVAGSGIHESLSPIRIHIDDLAIADTFHSCLPMDLADLIDVAIAVYVADRFSPRRSSSDAGRWVRHIEIGVPVRDPDRWNDPTVTAALRDTLWLFTEDEWIIRFLPRTGEQRAAELQPPLFLMPRAGTTTVALFSGGLDSLAGLWRDANERPMENFVLVSASTNPRLTGVQRTLIDPVNDALRATVVPVGIPFGLHRNGESYDSDEPTQRSRGIIFLVLGAVTAMMAGTDELTIYENGVGAINLPYTAFQRGAQHTRATAPHALVAMQQFIRLATGRPLRIRLPFLFETKGSLCTHLGNSGIDGLADRTVSCDGFPLRVAGVSHCGVCTSCLLRRQALHAAGLAGSDRGGDYLWDVMDPTVSIPTRKWCPLRLMLDQVESLAHALASDKPWRALSRQFPDLIDAANAASALGYPADTVEERLVDLYRRYCDEWGAFPARPPHWAHAIAA